MTCPMCETRAKLKQAERIIDSTPAINSPLYDNTIAEILNSISNAYSVFGCYCEENSAKKEKPC